MTYSNGDIKNLGKVTGEDGANGSDGADGLGIKSLTLSPSGELVVTMTDNSITNLGNIKGEKGDKGDQGLQGENGADGRGIAKTELINGELVITYTDGTSDNLGSVSGTVVSDSILMLKFDTLEDGTLQVSLKDDYKSVARYITIPSTFQGATVTTIAKNGFREAKSLTEVYLPETISTIGDFAFYGTNLPNINLPASLTSIGKYAFQNCKSLHCITIPYAVTKIDDFAFESSGLTEAIFENPINWKFYYCLNSNGKSYIEKETNLTSDQMLNKKTAAELLVSSEQYRGYGTFAGRTYERVG